MVWTALLGMASSSAGSYADNEATIEGAETEADIQRLEQAFTRERFEKELERQKPFVEAGTAALPLYQQAIKNKLDITEMPLYKMKKGMLEESFGPDTPDYIKERSMEMLGAEEGELAKTRLADIQQIGLGQAGAAGTSMVNYGTSLASSLSRESGALAQGTLSSSIMNQNMWNKAATDIGGLPAYMASRPRKKAPQPMGPSYTTDNQGRVVPVA